MVCVKCHYAIEHIEFVAMPAKGNAVRCRSGQPGCPGFMTADDIERWSRIFSQTAGRKANLALAEWLRSAPVELAKRSVGRVRKAKEAFLASQGAAERVEQWRQECAARRTRNPRRARTK